MEKILYVSPIFSPSDFLFKKNLESVISFLEYIETNEFNGYAVFSGFCKNDDNYKILRSLDIPENVVIERLDKNYGKGCTVNEAVKNFRRDSKFLLTADSDILFPPETPNMFNRLLGILGNNAKIGAIALNQAVRCCHWIAKMTKSAIVANEELIWNDGPDGVAGGCVFMPLSTWDKVGGYRNLGVYSGDDAMLAVDIKSKGFMYPIAKSISVIHPHNVPGEEKYQQWKVKRLDAARRSGCKTYSKEEFATDVNEIDKYWNNYE